MRRSSVRSTLGAVVSVVVAASWSLVGVPAAHATTTCDGLPATIVGSASGETLTGTNGDDVIVGLGGDDTIVGLAGNDRVCAGDGADTVYGEFVVVPDVLPGLPAPGPLEDLSDRVFGEAGDDVLIGNSGTGVISVSAAYVADNDHIDGGPGSDVISGGFLDVTITAVSGGIVGLNDTLIGGDDPDTIYGYGRTITVGAGAGLAGAVLIGNLNDTISGGGGGDTVYGDAQTANLGVSAPVTAETSNDTIAGGEGNDTIYGDYETLNSLSGAKAITSGHRDAIDAGPGDDVLYGDAKNGNANFIGLVIGNIDNVNGGIGTDTADAGPSLDTCTDVENKVNCEL